MSQFPQYSQSSQIPSKRVSTFGEEALNYSENISKLQKILQEFKANTEINYEEQFQKYLEYIIKDYIADFSNPTEKNINSSKTFLQKANVFKNSFDSYSRVFNDFITLFNAWYGSNVDVDNQTIKEMIIELHDLLIPEVLELLNNYKEQLVGETIEIVKDNVKQILNITGCIKLLTELKEYLENVLNDNYFENEDETTLNPSEIIQLTLLKQLLENRKSVVEQIKEQLNKLIEKINISPEKVIDILKKLHDTSIPELLEKIKNNMEKLDDGTMIIHYGDTNRKIISDYAKYIKKVIDRLYEKYKDYTDDSEFETNMEQDETGVLNKLKIKTCNEEVNIINGEIDNLIEKYNEIKIEDGTYMNTLIELSKELKEYTIMFYSLCDGGAIPTKYIQGLKKDLAFLAGMLQGCYTTLSIMFSLQTPTNFLMDAEQREAYYQALINLENELTAMIKRIITKFKNEFNALKKRVDSIIIIPGVPDPDPDEIPDENEDENKDEEQEADTDPDVEPVVPDDINPIDPDKILYVRYRSLVNGLNKLGEKLETIKTDPKYDGIFTYSEIISGKVTEMDNELLETIGEPSTIDENTDLTPYKETIDEVEKEFIQTVFEYLYFKNVIYQENVISAIDDEDKYNYTLKSTHYFDGKLQFFHGKINPLFDNFDSIYKFTFDEDTNNYEIVHVGIGNYLPGQYLEALYALYKIDYISHLIDKELIVYLLGENRVQRANDRLEHLKTLNTTKLSKINNLESQLEQIKQIDTKDTNFEVQMTSLEGYLITLEEDIYNEVNGLIG